MVCAFKLGTEIAVCRGKRCLSLPSRANVASPLLWMTNRREFNGYIVSAWVILQVAAIVFPSLELPSWSMKFVLDVLLLGFAPALLLGWHLDLRRGRAERSSLLKKDVAGDPLSPSEQTPL